MFWLCYMPIYCNNNNNNNNNNAYCPEYQQINR